ncbi:hypothetical protein RB195_016914 [Necator americanus]
MGHTLSCGQASDLPLYIAATSTVVNGILFPFFTVIFCIITKTKRYNRAFTVIFLLCSCACLLYAIMTSSAMFINLYFKFNPSCFLGETKVDVIYMSMIAIYNVISSLVLLLISIFSLDSTQHSEDRGEGVFADVTNPNHGKESGIVAL